jgi:hypothetical protein
MSHGPQNKKEKKTGDFLDACCKDFDYILGTSWLVSSGK